MLRALPSVFEISDQAIEKSYLIYVALLELDGHVRRAQVGSMSHFESGARRRRNMWKEHTGLPVKVVELLQEGYEIVHVGCIAMMPKPCFEHHPETRCWVLMLEALFTIVFWTLYQSAEKDLEERELHWLAPACEFDVDEFDYEGCGTHSPLREAPKGLELSNEQKLQWRESVLEKGRNRRKNRSAEKRLEENVNRRVENMTNEQIEKKRASQRRENMTDEQVEKRRASQRIGNVSTERARKVRDRAKKQRLTETPARLEKKRAYARKENMDPEKYAQKLADVAAWRQRQKDMK